MKTAQMRNSILAGLLAIAATTLVSCDMSIPSNAILGTWELDRVEVYYNNEHIETIDNSVDSYILTDRFRKADGTLGTTICGIVPQIRFMLNGKGIMSNFVFTYTVENEEVLIDLYNTYSGVSFLFREGALMSGYIFDAALEEDVFTAYVTADGEEYPFDDISSISALGYYTR